MFPVRSVLLFYVLQNDIFKQNFAGLHSLSSFGAEFLPTYPQR